ncbi:AraC family transcriptional regulator [Erythrobacter litoralis]|uniref:HTH araC/xylS-type domain-containing protein n=1 Tax=Erythrobacter litoralis (strain HTCC2594) TaxID=314225 RepID=Q2N6N8_ERYLH|nr:helix-turn-helix domain-containing protein [Erythrobacter litoralis]ABC64653.1 hypothetical protein ELI_12805 [Erythrobacter litoralis HTCC2594]
MDAPFRFEFVAAPRDLAPYVNTLFVFETDRERLDDILPAYSAQMITFGRGHARMQFGDDHVGESSDAFFLAPMQQAAPFSMKGPVRACGVSLTALGWAAIADLPVDTFGHRRIDADRVLGEGSARAMAAIGADFASGELEAKDACMRLADIVRTSLNPPSDNHADFIMRTVAWLSADFNPDVAELARATALSPRQVQRLCKRFFGKPPATLVKRYRAIRAATLLSQPDLDAAARNEVEAAYFDQAHMIRDIRQFTGRTPKHFRTDAPSVTSDTLGPEGSLRRRKLKRAWNRSGTRAQPIPQRQ